MATTKVSYKKSGGAENKQISQMFSESLNAQKSAKTVFQKMKVDEIKFDEKGEFQDLYDKDEKDLNNIAESMKKINISRGMVTQGLRQQKLQK